MAEFTSGKKESITRNGMKMQRRYMTASGKELHKKYNDTTHFNVSYPSFMRLRPFYVLKKDGRKRESCQCQRCRNIYSMASALKWHGVIKSADMHDLQKAYICMTENRVNEDCAAGKCSDCPGKLLVDDNMDLEKIVNWSQWTQVKVQVPANNRRDAIEVKKSAKVERTTTGADLARDLDEELSLRGARHIAVYKHQQELLQNLKPKLLDTEAIILMDFSENYACKYAEEIQSFHFGGSREQATIHRWSCVSFTRTLFLRDHFGL